MRRLRTLIFLPWHKKLLVGEAFTRLVCAWSMVRLSSFRKYSQKLGTVRQGEYTGDGYHDTLVLKDTRWAIEAVDRTFSNRFTCLMKAIAGKGMLNRRGISNTLVLGAKIDRDTDAGDMAAHAWLRSGQYILLGGAERRGYAAVASYHN